MTVIKWEGNEQRLGSGGLPEAEDFEFEVSKLNIYRLIKAERDENNDYMHQGKC